MSFIKKNELKNLIFAGLKSELGFNALKSRYFLYKNIEDGLLMVKIRVLDGYNFEADQVAWKVEISFSIGFRAVHEWFEKFEHRNKSDFKYYSTYSMDLSEVIGGEILIDVDDNYIDKKIDAIVEKTKVEFINFLKSNNCLEHVYMNKKLSEIRIDKYCNVRSIIENLSIIHILKEGNFENALNLYIEKLKSLNEIGDPMAKMYFSKFDEIIRCLKATDFSEYRLCLDYENLYFE